jgi:zinc/manganese transport system permease protein
LSIGFALLATEGGILASLASETIKPSVFITAISFAVYLAARFAGARRRPAYA